jgi:hypothetical protein
MAERPRVCIARGGEVAWRSPSAFEKARLYGFAVKADGARVDEMLARYIGRPSQDLGLHIDVRVTPLEHVFFVFLGSERHQHPQLGRGSEGRQSEQLFAIVVLAHRIHPDPGLVLFAPYVYASDTPGWRAEREIYGYPQQQGRVRIQQEGAKAPTRLSVEARVIERFSKTALARDVTFLSIERKPASAAGPLGKAPTIAQWIAQQLKARPVQRRGRRSATVVQQPRLGVTAADVSFFERCSRSVVPPPEADPDTVDLAALLSGGLPMLFLKQFRDVVHSDRACYQAIVQARLEMSGYVTEFPLRDYELDLIDVDSAPIRRELGIPAGKVDVDFAFLFHLDDMSIEDARVVSNPYWNPAGEVSIPDTPSRLPRYVDRGGEAVWRQPSLLFGARIYGFGVSVPRLRQEEELERCINHVARDSGSTYGSQVFTLAPLLDMVMLLFVEYKRITSGTDDDKRLGGVAYREFLAMQLALSDDEEFPELDWFIPFIYLDTDSPRLGGREIFGYPKQLGSIEPFRRYRDGRRMLEPAKELELKATVIRSESKNIAARHSVVKVEGPKEPPTIKRRYLHAQDMFTDLLQQAGDGSDVRRVLSYLRAATGSGIRALEDPGVLVENALAFGNIGNVFLKQFRDCANPQVACYQAVCKTDTVPGKYHGGGCLDPSAYRITIQNLASEPLLNYITGSGPADPPATMTPVFAYWLDLDFELTNGRVIANPFERGYVPDVSVGTTRPDRSDPSVQKAPTGRRVRRARQVDEP